MMHTQSMLWAVIVCGGVLAACAAPQKKTDVLDLYELPRGGKNHIIDNDSYYSNPGGLKACTTINDVPSCGGS